MKSVRVTSFTPPPSSLFIHGSLSRALSPLQPVFTENGPGFESVGYPATPIGAGNINKCLYVLPLSIYNYKNQIHVETIKRRR